MIVFCTDTDLITITPPLTVTGVITATGGLSLPGGKDYTPLQIGVKSSSAGDGFVVAGSGDDSGGVQIYGDDNGAAAAGEVITPFRSRYLLTVNQSGGVSQTALFAQLVSGGSGTRTYTTGGFRAAYVFNQQGTTTLVTSAEVTGINQATTLAGTMTVGSGCSFTGIDINIAGAGAISNSGTAAGLLIRASGTPVWPVGIQIPDGDTLTGIDIGSCTTGISMAGAYSTAALSINTTLASNDDYALYIVTTCADGTGDTVPVSISSTMSTAGSVGQALKVNQSVATVALGGYVNAIYGILTLGTTGSVSGLGAPICAEIVFPTGTVGGYGTLAGVEIELTTGAATTMLGTVSALWIQTSGATTAQVDHNGYLMTLVGFASDTDHMWYDKGSAITTGDASEWLRIKTPSGDRYLILYDLSLIHI